MNFKKLLTRIALLGLVATQLTACIVVPARGRYYGDHGGHGYYDRYDRGGHR